MVNFKNKPKRNVNYQGVDDFVPAPTSTTAMAKKILK
jgi:hypothetical protein